MNGGALEGLGQTLRHHIQITLLGALLVLAPLVLLVHTVLRARAAMDKAVAPLRDLLPGAKISVGGVTGIELATLLLALFVCWLLGWGIVRTRIGRRVKQWVEETFLKRTPVYQTYRRVTGNAVETPTAPAVQPALVQVAGDWQPGVVVEEQADGWATVFVPDIPAATSGRLYCIQAAQIRPLACSLDDFRKTTAAAGRGSRDWLCKLAESPIP
jgi:uncharacterized membrane protein